MSLTLPSECVALNGPVWEISIHPRCSRGSGNVEKVENSFEYSS